MALGNDTYALGGSSVAAGNAAWALGERSTAIGNNAHSEGYGSIAMGREAGALSTQDGDKKNVVAIGDDAASNWFPLHRIGRKRSSWYIRTCT